MRNAKPFIHSLIGLILTALLAACGSGSGSGADAAAPNGTVTQAVAVDPYIVGAVFQEVSADRKTVLQRESTPSDSQGAFTFARPLTPGSIVEMKVGQRGRHNGVPYTGLMKRKVEIGDDGILVVSPLTTLVANGASPREVLDNLALAGMPGLNEDDLKADPMEGLEHMTVGVSEERLKRLRAAMAVNNFMSAIGNFDIDAQALNSRTNFMVLENMVTAAKETLSPALFEQLSATLNAADPDNPVVLGDVIRTAVALNQTIVQTVRNDLQSNGVPMAPTLMLDLVRQAMSSAESLARGYHNERVAADAAPAPGTAPGTPAPAPGVDGQAVFDGNCAGCHNIGGNGSLMDLAGDGTKIQGKFQAGVAGHQSKTLSAEEIQALVNLVSGATPAPSDPAPGPAPDPGQTPDGQGLFDLNCASCHNIGTDGTRMDLAGDGAKVQGKFQAGVAGHMGKTLSAAEIQALVKLFDGTTPAPADPAPGTGPVTPPTGAELYAAECEGCHGALANTNINNRTAAAIQAAINANLGGMKSLVLTAGEVQAIADALPAPPAPDPAPMSGQALYDNNCAGCHKLGTYDTTGLYPDLDGKSGSIAAKITNGHQNISLSAEQLTALASFVADNSTAPVTAPGTTPVVDGKTLYDNNCAGCHAVNGYDASGSPDLAGAGSLVAGKLGAGHQGRSLTAEETTALADFLDQYQAPVAGPDYSNCTGCHGQPPNGTIFPNGAGAHAVHSALAGVGTNCAVCHAGAAHNDWIDIGIASAYNAKSGAASDNPNGTATCINVSCHGGKTTPDWIGGSINVDTQCTSCHASGTAQYNSYNSGRHSRHSGRACTDCHNTTKLAANHFTRLNTTAMEGPASGTIAGGATRVSSYNTSTKTCTTSCHSSKSW